jgi:putative transcriptional regulator
MNLVNQFLIAMPGIADGAFTGAVVYLCEHNENGALGLVINKPIDIKLKNLFDKVDLHLDRLDLMEMPVFFGGPVQTERGFVLHERLGGEAETQGGHYHSSLQIPGGLEMTTSKDVLEALSHGAGPKKILITLGYTGWRPGQLEEELGRNGWLNVKAESTVIFDTPVEQRYDKALSLLGIDISHLSHQVGHA